MIESKIKFIIIILSLYIIIYNRNLLESSLKCLIIIIIIVTFYSVEFI